MSYLKFIAPLLFASFLMAAVFVFFQDSPVIPTDIARAVADKPILLPLSANALTALGESNPFGLVPPVERFEERITKKTFGMYITPETSPVRPDRFTGYHTGVDAEFTNTTADIPVVAIADGTIVMAKWVNGYGGVVVIRHFISGMTLYALYGHLDEASFSPSGTKTVAQGDRIGILGDDHSPETDGVRKHLHFALIIGEKVDYRGYVLEADELSHWLDPLSFF